MYKTSIIISLISLFFCGCVHDVKPWEKETLAKATMNEQALNPILKQYQDHIYFSKEATTGGNSISGGGCGCN